MRNLEFQVGLLHGNAVGYCPQTGHMSSVSLAGTARRLERAGKLRVAPADRAALYEALGYMDDRPAVGGKVLNKIKKVAKKVVKVAKKVANSTLGKVIMSAVQVAAGPFGGAAIGALKTGISLAKSAKSKKKPKTPAAAKKQAQAKKAAPIAAALAKKKITPKQATVKAKKAGVPPAKVKGAAIALRVSFSAKAGNKKAQSLLSAVQMVDKAKSQPGALAAVREEVEAEMPADDFGTPPEAYEPPAPEPFDDDQGDGELYGEELPEGGDGEAYADELPDDDGDGEAYADELPDDGGEYDEAGEEAYA